MGAFWMESARVKRRGCRAPACCVGSGLAFAFAGSLAAAMAGCVQPPDGPHAEYAEIVAEEDARGLEGLQRVRAHLQNGDATARAYATRALGRLEDPGQLAVLETTLADAEPVVRAAAAMAMAQAVFRVDPQAEAGEAGANEIDRVRQALVARIGVEEDPIVLGSLAVNLGRLAQPGADERAAVEAGLIAAVQRAAAVRRSANQSGNSADVIATHPCQADSCQPLLGLARGVEAFARRAPGVSLSEDLLTAAIRLSSVSSGGTDSRVVADRALAAARVRRVAASALVHANQLAAEDAARLIQDEDWGVRRQVVIAALRHGTLADTVIQAGLADPDPRVRVEAVRAYDRWLRADEGCATVLRAMRDADPHVSNTAIGLLARPCPDLETQRQALAEKAAELADAESDWRGPARALHALAGIAPGEVGDRVAGAARHTNPFVRAWAARAAALAGDAAALEELSDDSDANVREAALTGLGEVAGAAGREAYLAALGSDDPQLVMTATRLLVAHTPAETPVSALLAPLARFTAAQRETERDARVALLDGIGAVGGFSRDDLAPYLTDYDPAIAERAAALLTEATGAAEEAAPGPCPGPRPPTQPDSPNCSARPSDSAWRVSATSSSRSAPTSPPPTPTASPAWPARDTSTGSPSTASSPTSSSRAAAPTRTSTPATAPTAATRSARSPTGAAPWAFPPAAATPATPRSSSIWPTTCAWTSTTRFTGWWWREWRSSTPYRRVP